MLVCAAQARCASVDVSLWCVCTQDMVANGREKHAALQRTSSAVARHNLYDGPLAVGCAAGLTAVVDVDHDGDCGDASRTRLRLAVQCRW